jgi:single-strand DNA-binding protein
MYNNRVALTGFLGKDAEVRNTSTNNAFTILSLATKRSWRDREAAGYKSETTWHRCIAFGKLADVAAALPKGAHVQIEGEIRTREYKPASGGSRKSITEIRILSLVKLDRPKTSEADETPGAAA